MPLPALPHARVVWLTRLHERGSDWLSIFSNIAEHKKKYFKKYIFPNEDLETIFFFFFFLDFRISKEKNKNKKNIFSVVLIGGIFFFFFFFRFSDF